MMDRFRQQTQRLRSSGPQPGEAPAMAQGSRVRETECDLLVVGWGCDQASVMGGHYPSGGINIGPALTFAYIAGRHCAGVTEYENRVPVPQNDGV